MYTLPAICVYIYKYMQHYGGKHDSKNGVTLMYQTTLLHMYNSVHLINRAVNQCDYTYACE